ncbi:imm11 family protein [Bradyrhizobium sp. GCM10027634]|uniref:imm11 family protein n=1 Tax=unclassified Bradyrhizobium TaxID=2631580 RepID=UPI00188A3402|nr:MULTISPECIES: DUF1629 domain-containing protein [unclassified Bradyrhizobium]MDN5004624.1 DUF1629 domain-containing protein [Bradyrhizobium sp. WYCCWR 12677]QOZ43934.1 hypothetical protein XH89_10875 [Bradyrhizobium sp. CCBAU 53340]
MMTASPGEQRPRRLRAVAHQRRFYRVNAFRSRGEAFHFELENEKELPCGLERISDLAETPRFLFDKSAARRPRDLAPFFYAWLISDRTKAVFESVDPNGFVFAQCAVRVPKGTWDGPPYWLCQVVRVLDALDEGRSRLKIGISDDPRKLDFGQKCYDFFGRTELVFREDLIGDAHMFRMAYHDSWAICDEELKNACKSAGLKIYFTDVLKHG